MRSKWLWAVVGVAVVLGITTAASATTRGLITGKMIAPHTVNSKHLVNHTIRMHDLSPGLVKSIYGAKKADHPALAQIEADGPYPSLTQLGDYAGAGWNSTSAWANDGTLQQSWVVCPVNKIAIGGGFGQNDVQTDQLVIVTSAPAEFTEDATGTLDYHPIDAAGSIVPNGWLVQGYNKSSAPLVVRPWVICGMVGSY